MITAQAKHFSKLLASSLLAILLFTGLFGLTISQVHASSAPNILNYQGRLLNANGVPISSSSASISFAIYTNISAGTCVWSNDSGTCHSNTPASIVPRTVTLTDGLFSENLGDTAASPAYSAISDSTFNNAALYLEVIVGGETLSPRKQLVAAPYAMNSDTLDGFDSTQTGGITAAALVLDSHGNLQLTGATQGEAVSQGSLYINPASSNMANDDDIVLGVAVDGISIFKVDGFGDATVGGGLTVAGDTLDTGDLFLNGGDLASTSSTFNFDNTSITKTINIGGTTVSAHDTINIATNNSLSDTIAIGNSAATFSLTGTNWSIGSDGTLTTAGTVNANGGTLASTTALAISSSGGDISLAPNGSGLAYVTAGDNFAVGNSTVTAAFSVTEASNLIRIGDGANDANDPTITMYSSDATNNGSLSYLDSDAFNFTGGGFVVNGINVASGSAQTFLDNTTTGGAGLSLTTNALTAGNAEIITRGNAVATDFTGSLLSLQQLSTRSTATGDALTISQSANNDTSCTASPCANAISIIQAHTAPHIANDVGEAALAVAIGEGSSSDDAIVLTTASNTVFRVTDAGDAYADGAFTGAGADLAEYFATQNPALGAGQLVCADPSTNNTVTQCSGPNSSPIGVISTNPAFIGNIIGDGSEDLRHNPKYRLVGLLGQIDTVVDASTGPITIGDAITSSPTPGLGVKATSAGHIVGYALEPLASGTGTIRVLVQPSWYSPAVTPEPTVVAKPTQNSVEPVVTIPVNTASQATNLATLDVDGSLNLNGARILSVSALQGYSGVWNLSANGDFTTHGQFIGLVNGYSGAPVETYAAMSRQHTIQFSGTSTLQNGSTHILFSTLDPAFVDVISHTDSYRVIATPSGLTGQLYISERDQTGFVIRDVSGSSGVAVDWLVLAVSKDFASTPSIVDAPSIPAPVTDTPVIDGTPSIVAPEIGGDTAPRQDEPVISDEPTPEPIDEPSGSSASAANPTTELSSVDAPTTSDSAPEVAAEPSPTAEPAP